MTTPFRTRSSLRMEVDVAADATLPDLTDLPGVAGTAADEQLLEAVHYDTDDLRLCSAGTTLRYRTGGADAGWQLQLPVGTAREEITVEAGPEPVPAALHALVRSRVRRRELGPVAALSTRRVAVRLLADDGSPLAELTDDIVTGRPLATATEVVWRAWEFGLLGGDDALLPAAEHRLRAAGARPAASACELDRVLSRPAPLQDDAWWSSGTAGRRRASVGSAVQAHLAQQVREVVARDPQTRRDLPDALHAMRVATRRLRSALATFRPLLDRERTDPVRDELRWLAGVLGAARDAEVLHARLRRLVAAEPDDLVLGPVQDHVDLLLAQRYRAAHDAVLQALDGERYLRLLDALDELVVATPFLPAAGQDAATALPHLVRRTWRRLDRRMRAVEQAPRGPEQDELLHQVRKDAKRTRYAAEAVQPVLGRPARRYAAAVADLQESLGDFRDGVVTQQVLRELGAGGARAGGTGFTFGRLHALEQLRGRTAVQRFPQARAAVSRRRLRRWFDR